MLGWRCLRVLSRCRRWFSGVPRGFTSVLCSLRAALLDYRQRQKENGRQSGERERERESRRREREMVKREREREKEREGEREGMKRRGRERVI